MKKAMFLAVCITLFAAAPALCLSVPTLINYQGVLTDANGNLITGTLTKPMIFSIYDAKTGGTEKWGPETQTVQIVNGQFNVLLGSVLSSPAITTAFDGPERYLSIKVDGVEILPRQQILSTGYAVQAERATLADNATNAVKVQGSNLSIESSTGKISSSMWRVSKPIPYLDSAYPRTGTFTSYGGTLLILASGSAYSSLANLMQIDIALDSNLIGSLKGFTSESFSHKSLTSEVMILPGISAGNHTIKMSLTKGNSDINDFSQLTVLELPF